MKIALLVQELRRLGSTGRFFLLDKVVKLQQGLPGLVFTSFTNVLPHPGTSQNLKTCLKSHFSGGVFSWEIVLVYDYTIKFQ